MRGISSAYETVTSIYNQTIRWSDILGEFEVCRDLLHLEPMDGCYIIFRNRAGTMLRVIFYDGDGFWLCEKTFSKGSIEKWFDGDGVSPISARELSVLLWRGDLQKAQFPKFWKKMSP